MQTLEEKEIPQIWTINRILKRNNLVSKREKNTSLRGNLIPNSLTSGKVIVIVSVGVAYLLFLRFLLFFS